MENKLYKALEDFRRARRRAALQEIMARVTGRPYELLPYDVIKPLVRSKKVVSRGLREIPLDAIVGSVGRYEDFTRSFLPRSSSDAHRWASVRIAVHDMAGLPPIEVYQVGAVYFVLDGNHRVSVAREIGAKTITAHVTELKSEVPISPEDSPDELICKLRKVDFFAHTRLNEHRPDADLTMTAPGHYRVLEEEIAVHRRRLEEERDEPVTDEEAALFWYDNAYRPVREVIRAQGILRDFPGRTEADLYVWLVLHQEELEDKLGWQVDANIVAEDLVERESHRGSHVWARWREALLPPGMRNLPRPGVWRRHRRLEEGQHLLDDILVPVVDMPDERGWPALSVALTIARRERGYVHGLHVVPEGQEETEAYQDEMRSAFLRQCQEADVPADYTVAEGDVATIISRRSRWIDLAVINLAYPPALQPLARLGSGFRSILLHTSRPILTVPHDYVSPMNSALLAFDGSPKANEALYLAAFLALKWGCRLDVVSVSDDAATREANLQEARNYLDDKGVRAHFVPAEGEVGPAILKAASERKADFVIMGSYSYGPALELVLGSAVNAVLHDARCPVLICR
jgi:nucleotide-binding universal stress UspA family protein